MSHVKWSVRNTHRTAATININKENWNKCGKDFCYWHTHTEVSSSLIGLLRNTLSSPAMGYKNKAIQQFLNNWFPLVCVWVTSHPSMCGEWFKHKKSQWLVPLGTRVLFSFAQLTNAHHYTLSYVLNHLITVIHMLSPMWQKIAAPCASKKVERARDSRYTISSKKLCELQAVKSPSRN